jgi:hypothetical protein
MPRNEPDTQHPCLAVPERLNRVERPEDIPAHGQALRRVRSALARLVRR